ncbi:hypothetical protein Tco_1027775, partial [Tanacetum coccineum]
FGHDHKDCKVRARTVEEITAEKVNVDKQVEDKKEDEINNMPGGGYRRFTGYNNQQWSRKVNNEEGNNASTNKGQGTEKDGPVKANKSQEVSSRNKDPQTSNNSFSGLRDLDDDNIQGMNILKDKIIVE